jgi:hypothetical protein
MMVLLLQSCQVATDLELGLGMHMSSCSQQALPSALGKTPGLRANSLIQLRASLTVSVCRARWWCWLPACLCVACCKVSILLK